MPPSKDELIPFLNLRKQHADLKDALLAVFSHALDGASFVGGPAVTEFEKDFSAYIGAKNVIGVGSGTEALRIALLAMGVGPGQRVVTVPNTFIATTEAISHTGAGIEFVDVDCDTSLMDPARLEAFLKKSAAQDALRGRVTAVIPVHLYGQTADMDPILALARKYELSVLEDAAQAHGASYRGRRAGCLARAAAFSFYPSKNLGACGEGGAVTTADQDLTYRIRVLRDHGQSERYIHVREGMNGRLHAIQAGFLKAKLPFLEGWNESRRKLGALYDAAFENIPWVRPVRILPHNVPTRHLYVIHVTDRDALREHLTARNIETGLHYPRSLHLQECYAHLGFSRGAFPNAEAAADTLLSLPMDPAMTEEQVHRVAEAVREFGT